MARRLAGAFPASRKMAALVVSHDRAFLDNTVTGILELDPATHSLRAYPGNYSAYLEQKLAEQDQQRRQYSDQQEEIARLQAAARAVRDAAALQERGGKGDSGDKFAKGFFANRTKETVARAKHIEKRLEQLLTVDRIDKPRQSWQMKLEFGDIPPSGRDVVTFSALAVGYDGKDLLSDLDGQIRYGERLALPLGRTAPARPPCCARSPASSRPSGAACELAPACALGIPRRRRDARSRSELLETVRRLAPPPKPMPGIPAQNTFFAGMMPRPASGGSPTASGSAMDAWPAWLPAAATCCCWNPQPIDPPGHPLAGALRAGPGNLRRQRGGGGARPATSSRALPRTSGRSARAGWQSCFRLSLGGSPKPPPPGTRKAPGMGCAECASRCGASLPSRQRCRRRWLPRCA